MNYRFELLRGIHAQGATVNRKTGKKTKDTVYRKGDVFESNLRLDKLFGEAKFKLLGQADEVKVPEDQVQQDEDDFEGGEEEIVEEDDGLELMSVAELRAYAKDQGIDLGRANRKSDIIDVIREETAASA